MPISDKVEIDNDKLIFQCPNCGDFVLVFKNELNCKIFRHAVHKDNGQNINPHTSENECKKLVENNLVFGCAKPFRIIQNGSEYKVQICEYI